MDSDKTGLGIDIAGTLRSWCHGYDMDKEKMNRGNEMREIGKEKLSLWRNIK